MVGCCASVRKHERLATTCMSLITLGIETSCDETGMAVLKDGRRVLADCLYSQVITHRKFGGVVPEIAARRHLLKLAPLMESVLSAAKLELGGIDLIAVTRGPGLIGPLLVGLCFAKALALARDIPIVGVNHLEGHLYSACFDGRVRPPFLGLIVSGGHTELISVAAGFRHRLLASTRDDAGGEALDKVGKAMGLPYPAGAKIESLALRGDRRAVAFTLATMKDGSDDFSFSGIKTAALLEIRKRKVTPKRRADLAASFQEAVCRQLVTRTLKVARQRRIKHLVVGGGVAANGRLRQMFQEELVSGEKTFFPEKGLCTDNALMVAYAGYLRYKAGQRDGDELDAKADLRIT